MENKEGNKVFDKIINILQQRLSNEILSSTVLEVKLVDAEDRIKELEEELNSLKSDEPKE